MKKGDLIIVYGTLRKGERSDLNSGFYSYGVDFIDDDRINGRLYHLGSFPGVKLDKIGEFEENRPAIMGEVYRIRDQSIIALIDAYEGYRADDPPHGLYDRKEVTTEQGRTVWVYVYNHPVIEDQRIPSGDWCKNRNTVTTARRLRA